MLQAIRLEEALLARNSPPPFVPPTYHQRFTSCSRQAKKELCQHSCRRRLEARRVQGSVPSPHCAHLVLQHLVNHAQDNSLVHALEELVSSTGSHTQRLREPGGRGMCTCSL